MSLKRIWIYVVFMLVLLPLTSDASRFEYRIGPFMSLGAGAGRQVPLNSGSEISLSYNPPILPEVSLRLGYGVKECRLYYVKLAFLDTGLGVGYMSFPENYDKVCIFGGIGTLILPEPTRDESDQYSSGIPLAGMPSVTLHGGIGYQWTRHSTIEFQLSYIRGFREIFSFSSDPLHTISASIVLQGFLW